MTSTSSTDAESEAPGAARLSAQTIAATLAGVSTKVSGFALSLLILANTNSIWRTVAVAAAMAVFYAAARLSLREWVARLGARPTAAGADLASAVALVGFAAAYHSAFGIVLALAAVIGGLRGSADLAHDSPVPAVQLGSGSPTTLSLIVPSVCGVVAGGVVTLAGAVAMVWLPAIALVTAAAVVSWTAPQTNGGMSAVVRALDEDTQELGLYRAGAERRIGISAALVTVAIQNAAQAGALAIVLLWVRGLLQAPMALGIVAGSFVTGALVGGVAVAVGHRAVQIGVAAAIGFAVAAVPGLVVAHLPGLSAVIACAAFVAGSVFAGGLSTPDVVVDYTGRPQERTWTMNQASAVAFLALPAAALAGAAIVDRLPLVGGLLVGAALYLAAVGAPMMQRAAAVHGEEVREATVPADPIAVRLAGVATWVAVTLIYAEGGWAVEVERKEGVTAGGHDVKSIDALRAIEALDLPGLREELERAIEDDQKRAEQETQRLKDELGGVDDRLSAIREMVEWSEMWRTNH